MQIVGLQSVKGKSKSTGKPYDAVILFVSYPQDGVIGVRVEDVWVPRSLWDELALSDPSDAFLGLEVFPSYDRRGYIQSIDIH